MTGEEWNFVFGCANMNTRCGCFSFARYDDDWLEDTGNKDFDKKNWDKILYRACKVMTHEIGHMFGIKHCVYFNCVMNGSNGEEENRKKP